MNIKKLNETLHQLLEISAETRQAVVDKRREQAQLAMDKYAKSKSLADRHAKLDLKPAGTRFTEQEIIDFFEWESGETLEDTVAPIIRGDARDTFITFAEVIMNTRDLFKLGFGFSAGDDFGITIRVQSQERYVITLDGSQIAILPVTDRGESETALTSFKSRLPKLTNNSSLKDACRYLEILQCELLKALEIIKKELLKDGEDIDTGNSSKYSLDSKYTVTLKKNWYCMLRDDFEEFVPEVILDKADEEESDQYIDDFISQINGFDYDGTFLIIGKGVKLNARIIDGDLYVEIPPMSYSDGNNKKFTEPVPIIIRGCDWVVQGEDAHHASDVHLDRPISTIFEFTNVNELCKELNDADEDYNNSFIVADLIRANLDKFSDEELMYFLGSDDGDYNAYLLSSMWNASKFGDYPLRLVKLSRQVSVSWGDEAFNEPIDELYNVYYKGLKFSADALDYLKSQVKDNLHNAVNYVVNRYGRYWDEPSEKESECLKYIDIVANTAPQIARKLKTMCKKEIK